jgi:hypothetical protein
MIDRLPEHRWLIAGQMANPRQAGIYLARRWFNGIVPKSAPLRTDAYCLGDLPARYPDQIVVPPVTREPALYDEITRS